MHKDHILYMQCFRHLTKRSYIKRSTSIFCCNDFLQISMDQLQMHFVSSINVVAASTLIDILQEVKELPEDISYMSLCKVVIFVIFSF